MITGYYKLNGRTDNYLNNTSGNASNVGYAINSFNYSCGSFNASNSQVSLGSTSLIKTITCWIKPTSSEGRIYQGATGSILYYSGNILNTSGTASNIFYVNGSLTTGLNTNWNFVGLTCNGINSDAPLIGPSGNCLLNEVRLYDSILTGDEIDKIFKQSYPKIKQVNFPINNLPDNTDTTLKGTVLNKNSNTVDYSTNNLAFTFSGLDYFEKIGAHLNNGSINWPNTANDSYSYWFQTGGWHHFANGSGINYKDGISGNYTLPYTTTATGIVGVSGLIKDLRIYTGSKTTDFINSEYLKGNPDANLIFKTSLNGNVLDHSVYKNNGILSGAQLDSKGCKFDGADDKVIITDNTILQNIMLSGATVMAWINPKTDGELDDGWVIGKAVLGGWAFNLAGDTGIAMKIKLQALFTGNLGTWRTTNTDLTNNTWNHVAVTYNSSSTANDAIIYVNGASKAVTEIAIPNPVQLLKKFTA